VSGILLNVWAWKRRHALPSHNWIYSCHKATSVLNTHGGPVLIPCYRHVPMTNISASSWTNDDLKRANSGICPSPTGSVYNRLVRGNAQSSKVDQMSHYFGEDLIEGLSRACCCTLEQSHSYTPVNILYMTVDALARVKSWNLAPVDARAC
jgi:hypothetical protein